MAINVVSVQYNGGRLPDTILLTQGYYHRGTRLNAMKTFFVFAANRYETTTISNTYYCEIQTRTE